MYSEGVLHYVEFCVLPGLWRCTNDQSFLSPNTRLRLGATVGSPPRAWITIVVPTFKRPAMLSACLKSIQLQSFKQFVVLVCDNSPEGEAKIVVESLKDDRFIHIQRSKNLGILGNAVAGFKAAQTDFVMEVDDDDLLYPDALLTLILPLRTDPRLRISFADLDVIDSRGRVLEGTERFDFLPDRNALREGRQEGLLPIAARGHIFMMAALLRTNAFDWDAIPCSVSTAYDRHLSLEAARNGGEAYYVDRRIAAYRVHAEADGMHESLSQLAGAAAALEVATQFHSTPELEILREEIIRVRLTILRVSLHSGGWRSLLPAARENFSIKELVPLVRILLFTYIPQRIQGVRGSSLRREQRRRRVANGL